uniref:USP domain-containing protein n=1 Tax=Strigamia maritima TaxID=126957 RepID=T1IU18_STRMM
MIQRDSTGFNEIPERSRAVLWHLDIFRRSFRDISGHACMTDSCIFCALKELFAQFQYSQESALPPDALRRALAETFYDQQRFQLGFMDDAAECFENMLMRIHFHIANTESEDMCNAPHCIPHQKFAMTLVEQSVCNACGATSEPLPFTQMVHYISASALCVQAEQMDPNSGANLDFGKLLRKAGGMGDFRACPSSCGAKIQIRRSLMNRPEIVSIGLVWDSERPSLEHIMNVFRNVGTTLKLEDLFHSVVDNRWASTTVHQLVGVVTYYGKHYSTFFFHTKLRVWIYFDDATVREIGPKWEQVVEKCQRGHFQPLLLLYANPEGAPVEVDSAPQTITYVAGHRKLTRSTSERQNDAIKGANKISQLRRAATPNPELVRDSSIKDVCPRRAITPNPQELPGIGRFERKTYVGGSPLPPLPSYDQVDASRRKAAAAAAALFTSNGDVPIVFGDKKDDIYISRKAVENVLNYQKLQRQRTLSGGGSRNSNSSLESFDSVLLRNMHNFPNAKTENEPIWDGKLDPGQILDPANLVNRRRDSGNWSGDRNSASSSSSIEPISNRKTINKRIVNGSAGVPNTTGGKPVEMLSNPTYDPGYDSYSLSSNDSFPLSQSKHNQQLAQIPEVPNWNSLSPPQYKLRAQNNFSSDNCEILCCEADAYLAKSQMIEDAGDVPSAISLCNSAAAKARAAMDAPYVNPQSVMLARMKHNTCVMKARSLQRRLITRQESIGSTTSTETDDVESRHTRQSSSDSKSRRSDGGHSHSRQGSQESRHSLKEGANHSRQTSKDSTHRIEIYATLPKKGVKLVEKMRSGSVRLKGEKTLYDQNVAKPKPKPKPKPTEETSDYSSEWEMMRKITLHRTNSSPPVLKNALAAIEPEPEPEPKPKPKPKPKIEPKPVNVPGKKQHKIRRKLLMGGLIKRKNRSMPDLREHEAGQEKATSVHDQNVAFIDDFQLPRERDRCGYLSDAHLEYGRRSSSERCLLSKQQQHGGSQRTLLGHPKMPPKPPVRTTSQLSLGCQSSSSKTTSLNASSPNLSMYPKSSGVVAPVPKEEMHCNNANNSGFLAELQVKRKEILARKDKKQIIVGNNENKSCSWLQELQVKQTKMKQNVAPAVKPINCHSHAQFAEKENLRNANNEDRDQADMVNETCNGISSLSVSVRDLAHKFEQKKFPTPTAQQEMHSSTTCKLSDDLINANGVDPNWRKSPICVENHLEINWKSAGSGLPAKPQNGYMAEHQLSKSCINAQPSIYPVNGHPTSHHFDKYHKTAYKLPSSQNIQYQQPPPPLPFAHQHQYLNYHHQQILTKPQHQQLPPLSNQPFQPTTANKTPYHQVSTSNSMYHQQNPSYQQTTLVNTTYQQVPPSNSIYHQQNPLSTQVPSVPTVSGKNQKVPSISGTYPQVLPSANGAYQQVPPVNGAYQQVPSVNGAYQQVPSVPTVSGMNQKVPSISGTYPQVLPSANGAYQQVPPVNGAYQQVPSVNGAYQQVLPSANGAYQQVPSVNGAYQQALPSANGAYQQVPPVNGAYQQVPSVNGAYQQVPPVNGAYQQVPPVNGAYQQVPSSVNMVYQQVPSINGAYHQVPAINGVYLQSSPVNSNKYQSVSVSVSVSTSSSNLMNCGVAKKKKNVKKSVTFSDQVALVASADEDNELRFLDRVYKTVVAKNNNAAVTTNEETPVLPRTNQNPTNCCVINKTTTNVNKVPCHLCRKKSVIPPTVYCPDCDFYMSRFKPKV